MSHLFLLSGAVRRDPAIDAWLFKQNDALAPLARKWFERMRRCGEDVRELMHDGAPTVCVADAAFAYVNAFRAHVNVGFFHGATLDDPARLLEGAGKRMRHVKIRPDRLLNEEALAGLITTAYDDIRSRLAPR
jgi:hypothetical protein